MHTARSAEEVESLRPVWDRFAGDVANADIDYHVTLVDRSPEALRPHVLLVERDGVPTTLVVGRVEDVRLPVKLGYKTLQRPRVRALTVSSGGVLGQEDEATAAAVLGEISSALGRAEADVARLRNRRVGSPLHSAARSRPGILTRDLLSMPTTRWRARLEGSYEDYLARRTGKTRANLRRYGRKFEDAFPGAIEFRVFRDPADLDQLLHDTGVVYATTYQHGLGVGFSDSGIEMEITSLALARGWFRGFVLYVEGKPCAFWHGSATAASSPPARPVTIPPSAATVWVRTCSGGWSRSSAVKAVSNGSTSDSATPSTSATSATTRGWRRTFSCGPGGRGRFA